MSKVSVLQSVVKAADVPREYLGPAIVVAVDASSLDARLPDGGVVRAELALAYPYRPAADDAVLVVGRDGAHYVIGVLRGSGETTLAFEGDVRVRAVGGRLVLAGDEGVQIEGRELEVVVSAVKIVADRMVQKLATAYQRVTGLLSVRAGDAETHVEGTTTTRAKNGVVLTEEKMVINGKQIFLG